MENEQLTVKSELLVILSQTLACDKINLAKELFSHLESSKAQGILGNSDRHRRHTLRSRNSYVDTLLQNL